MTAGMSGARQGTQLWLGALSVLSRQSLNGAKRMKRTLLALAAGLFMTGTPLVFAQTGPAPSPAPQPPAAKPTEPPAAKPTGTQWYSHQTDEMRASKLISARV